MIFDETQSTLDSLAGIDKDSNFIFVYEINKQALRPDVAK